MVAPHRRFRFSDFCLRIDPVDGLMGFDSVGEDGL